MSDTEIEKSLDVARRAQQSPTQLPTSSPDAHLAEPPISPVVTFPEGSMRGWLTVLGCWAVMFFTFGYVNAFGYDLPKHHVLFRGFPKLTVGFQGLRILLYRNYR